MTGTLTVAQARQALAAPQARADRRPAGDVNPGPLVLRTRTHRLEVTPTLREATLERTIDGASTVEVTVGADRGRTVLDFVTSPASPIRVVVDGLVFVLVRVARGDDGSLALTFEDEAVWALRQVTEPRKARRSATMTRFRFIEHMARESREHASALRVSIPEVGVVQPVAPSSGPTEPYEFSRGGDGQRETTWDAIQRLVQEVGARAFVSNGVLYVGSDDELMRTRPRFAVSHVTRGVHGIAWTRDAGVYVDSCSIAVDARRWQAGPGTVVHLRDEGPADGLWLVSSIRRPLTQVRTTVELTRPQRLAPEPAGEARQQQQGGGPVVGGQPGGFTDRDRVTVKGARASAEQLKTIHGVLTEVARSGGSQRLMVAAVMTITQESNGGDPRYTTRGDAAGPDSRGPFQQRAPWGSLQQRMDPTTSTRLFLNAWRREHGGLANVPSPLTLAINKVQRSAHPNAYAQWEAEATRTVNAWLANARRPATAAGPIGGSLGGVPATVIAAQRRAEVIHQKRQYYKWGGGHGNIRSEGPYDCSSMVSNVLGPLGAGILRGPDTLRTWGLLKWGQAGRGRFMTVWVSQTHTFIEFHWRGFHMIYEAQKTGTITGRRPPSRSKSGLGPRHYPGA